MGSILDATLFTSAFVTLFVIMDPIGTVPLFLSLTGGMAADQVRRAARQAVLVSFLVIVVFAFFGQRILAYLHVSLPALQCAGGLLLLLVALELLTGRGDEPDAPGRRQRRAGPARHPAAGRTRRDRRHDGLLQARARHR